MTAFASVGTRGRKCSVPILAIRSYSSLLPSLSFLIRPLSEKFGIGIYYDDANPRFLDPLETAALLTKAKKKTAEEEKKAKETREEYGRIAKIGAERLRPLIPTDAKAVIIGTLRVNECDSYTDYYDYSIARTVSHAVIFPVFVICVIFRQIGCSLKIGGMLAHF